MCSWGQDGLIESAAIQLFLLFQRLFMLLVKQVVQ